MKEHKHCELIKAWAEGETIEYLRRDGEWVEVSGQPLWDDDMSYRIKPKSPTMLLTTTYKNLTLTIHTTSPEKLDFSDMCRILTDTMYSVSTR